MKIANTLVFLALLTAGTSAYGSTVVSNKSCKIVLDTQFETNGVNQILAELTTRALKKKGYSVVAAEGADDALALKVALSTKIGRFFGTCTISSALRGTYAGEEEGVVLKNVVNRWGLISKMGSACISAAKTVANDLPDCEKIQGGHPTVTPTPAPTPTPTPAPN